MNYIRLVNPQIDWQLRSIKMTRKGTFMSNELPADGKILKIGYERPSQIPTTVEQNDPAPILAATVKGMSEQLEGLLVDRSTCDIFSNKTASAAMSTYVRVKYPKVNVNAAYSQEPDMLEETVNPKLDAESRARFIQLLEEHSDLFEGSLGEFKGFKCIIKMKPHDKPPVKNPYYLPPDRQRILNNKLDELEREGMIKEVTGQGILYASPVMLIAKKTNLPFDHEDQEHRMVCDFRDVNALMEDYPTVPPNTRDIFAELARVKYKAVFDMSNGFFQVNLEKDSQQYTGIITQDRSYVFNRLPQGIKIGPAVFQEVANWIC